MFGYYPHTEKFSLLLAMYHVTKRLSLELCLETSSQVDER
jgi:hypothetical protein